MRILSFTHSNSGCGWIRLKMPLTALSKKHIVIMADGSRKIFLNGWQIVIFNNIMADIDLMVGGDVATRSSVEEMIATFKKNGSKIVYDIDDALDLHPHKFDYGKVINKNLKNYFFMLKAADLITVTTPQLKKHIQKYTKKPIAVLPNCINPLLFKKRKIEDKVKIGFAGSQSHIPDLDIVMPTIHKLKKKHGVYFEILGFQKDNCKWKKPVPINKYYDALADLGADIGICPLLETDFNKSKSPLKFLEYAMVGTMVLASNRYPYKGEMKPEWLVDDDKWEETLEKFILDKDLRERTLKEQREWVMEHRNINEQYTLWENEYRKLLK